MNERACWTTCIATPFEGLSVFSASRFCGLSLPMPLSLERNLNAVFVDVAPVSGSVYATSASVTWTSEAEPSLVVKSS